MGALWQWWLGFAPRVAEELLTWSWHMAGLVVLVWVATMLLRSKHARVRGALWLAALLLIPLLPTLVRLSPLPSTSVAELASRVRPAKDFGERFGELTVPSTAGGLSRTAPAPPAAEPTLPAAATAASVEPLSPAARTTAPVETVSPAAEAASAPLPEPMVAARSQPEAWTSAFWQEGRFWIGSAVLAWALIAAVRLARVLASLLWIRKLVRSAGPVGDARLAQAFATACRQIGVSKRVELLSSDLISVPVTVGMLRPAVIVPRDLTASGKQGALDHVLYHELAHVRRSDAAVTLYRRVLEAVLFFHPFLWLASRRYEVEQEHICDDWALAALGDRGGYARALSELAAQATHAAPVAALGFAHRPSIIRLRVTRVLEETGMPQPRLSLRGIALVAVLSLSFLVLATSLTLRSAALGASGTKGKETGGGAPASEKNFIVTGTVTEGKGNPMPGVEITATCGVLTLSETGKTTTGEDGTYALRFGPGMKTLDERSGRWVVFPQAATIAPRKAGWYEKNLHRQGGLLMASEMPPAENAWGAKPERVVLPLTPKQVDFVMLPGATIEGRLLDSGGRPWPSQEVYLTGKELPPSSEILPSADTDAEGRFTFAGVPLEPFSFWFTVHPNRTPSNAVAFERPGTYEVLLTVGKDSSTLLASSSTATVTPAPPPAPAVTPGGQQASPAPAAAATATEMTLKHDDGTMEGKRSLGASGHFVQFETLAPGKWYLTEVQIFGSRYGSPEPPSDPFTITLCDNEFKTVKSIKKPYSIFQRGEEQWYKVPVPPLELPEAAVARVFLAPLFWINVAFNPSNTKGVYVGYDTSDAECFSKVGLPDQTPEPTPDNGDWMIRLVVTQNPPKQVAPELGTWVEPPKPARSWQEEGLVELKNDDGKSDGKLSMGGTGPASRFEGVPEGATLTRLRMYASSYGSGFDPETTFADYYVFDDEKRILQTGKIPYSLFTYEEKWVDIPLKPVKVPSAFWVLVNPQAHQSKGIYTHYDTDVQATHSKSGRTPEEMRDLEKKWDWMIRAYVQLAVVGRQESVPVVETELWRVEGGSYFILLSPDGKTVALTVRGEPPQKQYVLRDGKRVGGTYDILQGVTFSPDSQSLAFAAESGDKWFMVKDGEALDGGHEGADNPVFSPDSRSLAYAVTDGREHFVLRDGERAGPGGISWAGFPVFSPDGRSLVYITARGEQYSIVRDGVATPALGQRMVSKPVFSPDGRSIAYVAESGGLFRGPCFLVRDGERVGEEGTYVRGPSDAVSMGVNNPVFSPDGSSLAWVAPAGRKEFVIRDGVRASRDYDRVAGIAFSPDGRSLSFLAREGVRSIVIRDGVQVGPQYDNVVLAILYSPDGRSIAFKAQQRRRTFIIRDGQQVTPDYEQISNIVTTPDGKTMVFAAIRDKVVYRVEVPWAEAQPANGR